ncbi:MAG TPA: Ger(x)C family spore germination protein [Tissierellaceae bacterium]|nr:Ger(x)C family spore germination protein [Tissierellaceae bacterium]
MRKILLIILIFSMIFTTACWDMIDVNDRIFPYSVGIDLNDKENEERFLVNFSYPNINAIGSEATSDIKSFMISSQANNIFDAMDNLSNKIQNPIYLKHLKVLIVSEEVAKDPDFMREIIGGLDRDYIMNKMIDLLVVKNSAKEFTKIKVDSTRQESVGGVLHELLRNEQRSTKFTPKTLNMFIKDMDNSSASTIPVGMESKESAGIMINGGAIFKDYRLVGYVDGVENRDIAILTGDASQAEIDIDFHGKGLSLLINRIKSTKELVDKESLKIKFNIEMEGQLHQYTMEDGLTDEESDQLLQEMELSVKEHIEESLSETINKLQNELYSDVLGISSYLSKFHPNLWDTIKDDWDNIYSNIDIEPDVEMHIRRRGLIK